MPFIVSCLVLHKGFVLLALCRIILHGVFVFRPVPGGGIAPGWGRGEIQMKRGRKHMKHKQGMIGFISGILVSVLVAGTVLPAVAAGTSIWVDSGVKVYVNDMPIDAGDTHGNPDAFIYNGTTYVAAAAVSKSLGENVKWDGSTKSVYIGKHEGSKSYLLNVCPPYESKNFKSDSTYTILGKKYANGFTLGEKGWLTGGWALFNLDGKYDTLSFDIGYIDGRGTDHDATYNIYLDGELVFSVDTWGEMKLQHYEVPLNGAVQMKIVGEGESCYPYAYAMVNVQVF